MATKKTDNLPTEEPFARTAKDVPPYSKYAVSFQDSNDRTHQQFESHVNVNNIVARHTTGRPLDHLEGRTPMYGDFSNVDDYLQAVDRINNIESDFMDLPAAVRAHVDNDPAKFIEAVRDPDQVETLLELGADPREIPTTPDDCDEPSPVPSPNPPDAEGTPPKGES